MFCTILYMSFFLYFNLNFCVYQIFFLVMLFLFSIVKNLEQRNRQMVVAFV